MPLSQYMCDITEQAKIGVSFLRVFADKPQSFKDDIYFQQVGYAVSCVLMTSSNFSVLPVMFLNLSVSRLKDGGTHQAIYVLTRVFLPGSLVSTVAISWVVQPKNPCSIPT
jgi:hypothetical protein